MPRPKVHPSQRKRAAEACNFCRMSKKKCSATVPCTACQRRGIGHTCYLTNSPRTSRSNTRRVQDPLRHDLGVNETPSAAGRQSQESANWPLNNAHSWVTTEPESSLHQGRYQPISPSESRTAATDTNCVESNSSPVEHVRQTEPATLGRESHARMLLNLRGERGMDIPAIAKLKYKLTCPQCILEKLRQYRFFNSFVTPSPLKSDHLSFLITIRERLCWKTSLQIATLMLQHLH